LEAAVANGQPQVIVLGGPNGCGKTTSSQSVLADTLKVMTFVNADQIARGLAGFDPDSAAVEASRVMLERLRELARQRVSFAFETTLAGRSYASLLRQWKQEGYRISLFYFWVASADLAVSRVAARVHSGGHHVPEATIRQRYQRSMMNFFSLYRPLADAWRWYDNSEPGQIRLLARSEAGGDTILYPAAWQVILTQVQS
jgi:predicted ABC-type ATPase